VKSRLALMQARLADVNALVKVGTTQTRQRSPLWTVLIGRELGSIPYHNSVQIGRELGSYLYTTIPILNWTISLNKWHR